jgi:hypothetical protein
MRRLITQLRKQMAESCKVNAVIAANMKELGYGG